MKAGAATLISDITLGVEAGTWCTIIGPNGAGKTTLVEAVAGLRRIASGTVQIAGQSISDAQRTRAGATRFPGAPAPPGARGNDGARLRGTWSRGLSRSPTSPQCAGTSKWSTRCSSDCRSRASRSETSRHCREANVSAWSSLGPSPSRRWSSCSTSHDWGSTFVTKWNLLELLKKEVADCGLTIIATLHDLTLAGQFADRLVLLDQGVVVIDGPARDVMRSHELSEHYGMNLRVIDVDGSDVIVPVRH